MRAPQAVPDETELPHAGYSPSRYLSAVTAHYFDTYLAPRRRTLELERGKADGSWLRLISTLRGRDVTCRASVTNS